MAVQIGQQRGQTDNFSSEDREWLSTECTSLKMGTEGGVDGTPGQQLFWPPVGS